MTQQDPIQAPELHWASSILGKGAVARRGRVTAVHGTILEARFPDARLSEVCRIHCRDEAPLAAEVVGFHDQGVLMMPLGHMVGVEQNALVEPVSTNLTVTCGEEVRGRVIDALGRPLDGLGEIHSIDEVPLIAPAPNPLERQPVREVVSTGIRAIDGLLTCGRGQRIGVFAAAGVGKTTLLAMLTRNVKADRVVVALIGERGREVREFIEHDLGPESLSRATVVVSTSDQPAVLRLKAAYTATAIAEAARRNGEHVLLLVDSVTRFARAIREVGLAAGEIAGRQGFPPSVFATLPRLFERAGTAAKGAITAFYTVLVAGDDLEEPIADETLSLLDGHIILCRRLAAQGHYPAIDVAASRSRLMSRIASPRHQENATYVREVLSDYDRNAEIRSVGLYQEGQDPDLDRRLNVVYPRVQRFLQQSASESIALQESQSELSALRKDG